MKILNIFKKESSRNSDSKKSNIQALDRKQLEKVIGGTDAVDTKERGISINTSHIEYEK